MSHALRLLATVLLVLWQMSPAAAVTCNAPTSSGFVINYVNGTAASVQAQFSVTCTRTTGDPVTSVTYSVKADNGLHWQGQNNQAILGAALLRYDVYPSSTCAQQWKGNTTIDDTITWTGGSTGAITKLTSFWGCVTGQTASASGGYGDAVTMSLSYPGGATVTGTIPVTIYAPAVCSFTTPPGAIALSYTSFGGAASGFTTFGVRCTTGMTYTLSTDVPEGVLLNLRYVLSLSQAIANGTGAPQSHTVTATIPAGQAGTCGGGACTGTNTHTITVGY